MESLVKQVGLAIAEDGRSLDSVGRDPADRFLLLLPETQPDGAEIRLRRLHQLIIKQSFTLGTETVRLTPVTGFAGYDQDTDVRLTQDMALTALDHAAIRLDLEPVRYNPSMGIRSSDAESEAKTAKSRSARAERLRLTGQIALVHFAGVILPFLTYVVLASFGINIVPAVYMLVVFTLIATAALIWIEGYAALQIRNPPEPEETAPAASGIIAAYLPNEAATIVDTVEAFLRIDYPGDFEVILAYNTPRNLPVEAVLQAIAQRDPRFRPMRIASSTSKAQNVNAALVEAKGEIIGVFDADHHPMPGAFTRAWHWIASGYDIVQGHCVVRNGDESALSRTIAIEFETIYGVSHPGRAQLHDFGIFGGSNGYWRTDLLRKTRMHGFMLTEDIDSSIRAVTAGYRICSDPGLISEELAPVTFKGFWNQRMRWAQGWFQVSRKHFGETVRSDSLTRRQKAGMFHLLCWREIYPWLSLQMWPIIAFWIWTYGSVTKINWLIPIFVLTTLFTLSVGPGQVLFSYLLAAPQIRERKRWFWMFLLTAPIYSELKNVIARVAQIKEVMGDRQWKVTPRGSADDTYDDEAVVLPGEAVIGVSRVGINKSVRTEVIVVPDLPAVAQWTLFDADISQAEEWTRYPGLRVLADELISDGTDAHSLVLVPYVPICDRFAVEAEIRMMCPDAYGGRVQLLAGVRPLSGDARASGIGAGFDSGGRGTTILTINGEVSRTVQVGVDSAWHTLRLEVDRGQVRFLIDGAPLLEQQTSAFAQPGQIGIASHHAAWRLCHFEW